MSWPSPVEERRTVVSSVPQYLSNPPPTSAVLQPYLGFRCAACKFSGITVERNTLDFMESHVREAHRVTEESHISSSILLPASLISWSCKLCQDCPMDLHRENVLSHIQQVHSKFYLGQASVSCVAVCRVCLREGTEEEISEHSQDHRDSFATVEDDIAVISSEEGEVSSSSSIEVMEEVPAEVSRQSRIKTSPSPSSRSGSQCRRRGSRPKFSEESRRSETSRSYRRRHRSRSRATRRTSVCYPVSVREEGQTTYYSYKPSDKVRTSSSLPSYHPRGPPRSPSRPHVAGRRSSDGFWKHDKYVSKSQSRDRAPPSRRELSRSRSPPARRERSRSRSPPARREESRSLPSEDRGPERERLERSRREDEGVDNPYHCPACQKSFPELSQLKAHIKTNHDILIKCKECEAMGYNPAAQVLFSHELIDHYDVVHNKPMTETDLPFFGKKGNGLEQMKPQGYIHCNLCPKPSYQTLGSPGLWFTNSLPMNSIKEHFRHYHPETRSSVLDQITLGCQLCQDRLPGQNASRWTALLSKHRQNVAEEGKKDSSVLTSACSYCGELVPREEVVSQKHIKEHHHRLTFSCKLCPLVDRFYYDSILDVLRHLHDKHFGERTINQVVLPGTRSNFSAFAWAKCKTCDFRGIGWGKEVFSHLGSHPGSGLDNFDIFCRICPRDDKGVETFENFVEFQSHFRKNHCDIINRLPQI